MRVEYGIDAAARKRGERVPVAWDSAHGVNAHCLLAGMSGAGKTHTLRRMIDQMRASGPPGLRFHVFDVHGDLAIEGASDALFGEQAACGLNPLRVNPDPHHGGVRKQVQRFLGTIARVNRCLGPRQEAVLRNILYDLYAAHGFHADRPDTWTLADAETRWLSDGSDGRLYLDVPIGEKDEAKALGARWESERRCWFVPVDRYAGPITRWPPKTLARRQPTVRDALRMARHVLQRCFLGTGQHAITRLELANKAAAAYRRRRLEHLRRGETDAATDELKTDLDRAKQKAVDAFAEYADRIATGRELHDVLRYGSTELVRGIVDRMENLDATGIFKNAAPPFDPAAAVWRYRLAPLSLEERKLFVLFRLEELFAEALQRGARCEVADILVLDEAHIYADGDPDNIVGTVAKEGRKFGLALICASQSPTHFTEDFISSVATKVILGIDEMYWRGAAAKMAVKPEALAWIKPQRSLLVQVKTCGETRNDWRWTLLDRAPQ